MMGQMIVVTAGRRYIDIDAYACCIAYAELLNLLGKPAIAASTAPWNKSITSRLRNLSTPLITDYAPSLDDEFVIVDLSDPAEFDKIVDQAHIIEIFDHHPGFEQYWMEKLGNASHIELIGAAATQIYEAWVGSGKAEVMSKESAGLLAAAILDNTLNFKAGITTERDKTTYAFLAKHANLDDVWAAKYFMDCQNAIVEDFAEALRTDTKFLKFKGLHKELCFGQIAVWDAKRVIADELQTIPAVLADGGDNWMANIISISDGRSYFVAQDDVVKSWAENLLDLKFDQGIAIADRLWLRKEVLRAGNA